MKSFVKSWDVAYVNPEGKLNVEGLVLVNGDGTPGDLASLRNLGFSKAGPGVKAIVTIEYPEPVEGVEIPPQVHEFHTLEMCQERPVHTIFRRDGTVERLAPDHTTTTVIKGTYTKGAVSTRTSKTKTLSPVHVFAGGPGLDVPAAVHRAPWAALVEDEAVKALAQQWQEDNDHKELWVAYFSSLQGEISMDPGVVVQKGAPYVERYLARLQGWFDEAVTNWLLQPVKDTTEEAKAAPLMPCLVWVAPEANPEQCDDIRAQVRRTREDPDYSILTNFQLSWMKVSPGDIVVVEDGTADQVQFLRAELDKALNDDPAHIVVLPFEITVSEPPPA